MKTRAICFVIALLLTAGAALAQPEIEWERTYGGGYEACYSVIQTTDGGFAMAGYTESFGAGSYDFWLVRTDRNGDSLWSRTYGGVDYDFCRSLIQTADGGFAMAGGTNSFGAGDPDFWLVRTDANGDSLWSCRFGGEQFDYCNFLIQTTDGGFAMAGYTESFGVGGGDFWLVRTDGDGDSLWSRTFGGRNEDVCYSLIQTADGGFAMAGESDSDFWLVRTDGDGDSLWSRTFGGVGRADRCYSFVQTADGGFAMAGESNSFSPPSYDFWLVRTDESGDSLWSSTFGGEPDDGCYSLIQTTDGGFALAGSTYSFGAGEGDLWIVRTDEDGDSLWSETFGGVGRDYCTTVIGASDGGYVLAGTIDLYDYANFYLVKTSPDPASVPDHRSTLNPSSFNLFPAFPNPFNSMVTIPFGLPEGSGSPMQLAIFDPLGRRVADLIPGHPPLTPPASGGGKYSVIWDASGVPAGNYIIQLNSGNQQLMENLSLIK